MRALVPVTRAEHMPGAFREGSLPLAAFGSFAGQPFELRFDLRLVDQHLSRLRALGRFLPFGQAAEEPLFRAFGFSDMRREHARPRPAQARERL